MKKPLAGAIAAAAPADPDPEQLSLLPSSAKRGSSRHDRIVDAARRDRAGRPPGARNLATREMLAFVRKTFGDPVERRARWLLHSPASLALELGCTPLEAFDRLDRIASELSRLWYAQLAPVDATGNAVAPFFALSIGGRPASERGGKPWEYMQLAPTPQTIENAAQSETGKSASYGSASYETPKPLKE